MPAIYRLADRPRPTFDLLSLPDASTVLPMNRQQQRRYACCYGPYGPPNETISTLNFFFLAFVRTTRPTRPTPGGPRRGDLTKRLGASLFKSGERELGDNGVLGGTKKNGRLLAIRSTSPGRAIWQQNCRTAYTYQPDVRTGAVRPEFFSPDYLLLCLQLPS